MKHLKNRPFRERLHFALAGLSTAWLRESSLRTHGIFAALAGISLAVLRPSPVW